MSTIANVFWNCSPTQRAADKWDSARFLSLFLAAGLYWLSSRIPARPLAANASR